MTKKNNNEFICTLNSPTNSLQFYNLNGDKFNEIVFKHEGPNSTEIISGFLYISKDSIFILNNQHNKIFRVSENGSILKSYQLPSFSQDKYFLRPWTEDGTEIFQKGSHLYIPGIPWINYDKNPTEYYNKGLLSIDLNLENGSSKFQIPYPNKDQLIDKAYTTQSIHPKCIANTKTGNLIYSFGVDPYVYEYSTEGVFISKNLLGTKNPNEGIKPLENRRGLDDPIEEMLNYTNNLCYERLFYDKYRNLYYRFVKHSIPNSQEYTRKDFHMGKKPWFKYSLIIADSNFNILDEIALANNTGSGAFLITREGIMLQKENEDENIMEFDLFKVDKK